LAAEEDEAFDVILLDAFGSDAPPVHLLTREAVEVYKKKLKKDGLLVVNLANRHLDLEPVLGKLAQAAEVPALIPYGGEDGCVWGVLARDVEAFGILPRLRDGKNRWLRPAVSPAPAWTDDYSDLFGIFRWDRGPGGGFHS